METLIRKLETFGPLSIDDRQAVRDAVIRRQTVGARTDIIREGEVPSDVRLITKGFACRYKMLENGARQIVAYLLPGDFCDLHVFILQKMDHGIATLSPCEVVEIPHESILVMLERPALSKAMLMATLVDEATLREWILNVGQRKAENRIAHLFCELHARLRAVGLAEGGSFDLPISQVELGDTVGLSTVHVNRSLQALRAQNLIEFRSRVLHISDVERLEKMSGFTPNYLHLVVKGDAVEG